MVQFNIPEVKSHRTSSTVRGEAINNGPIRTVSHSKSSKKTDRREGCPPQFIRMALGDLIQLANDLRLHHRDVETLRTRASHEGMAFLTLSLKKLGDALLQGVETGTFRCPNTFKRKGPKSALPALLGQQFARIFDDSGALLRDYDVKAFRTIRQVCTYLSKAELPRKKSQDEAVLQRFKELEFVLRSIPSIPDDEITRRASMLIGQIFKDFSLSDLSCKHGPGKVSNFDPKEEGKTKYDKRISPLPSYELCPEHFFFNGNEVSELGSRLPVRDHLHYFGSSGGKNTAEVILVPKDIRGPRLISCEPTENQYVQQGVMARMVKMLEGHPWSAGHVNFTDQTINQALALKASRDGSLATLDLKDASDRITMVLVQKLFAAVPELLSALTHIRSTHTLVPLADGSTSPNDLPIVSKKGKRYYRLPLAKHAPMGSATCFPVMATCLWSILVSTFWVYTNDFELARSLVWVYGDDIIVPTALADVASGILERYYLLVNRDKSFSKGPFRESCGTDALGGSDVTPIKLRKAFPCRETKKMKVTNPKVILSTLATANLLERSGCSLTAERLFRRVEDWLGASLPYGHMYSPYLCRWAPVGSEHMTFEMNLDLGARLRWKMSEDLTLPFGRQLLFFGIKPKVSSVEESLHGFLARKHHSTPSKGKSGEFISWYDYVTSIVVDHVVEFGEFVHPRDFVISKGTFSYYDMCRN